MIVKNYSLDDFDKEFESHFYGGWKSNTGIKVNEESAMKFSAVYACIRIISEDIGLLPMEIRRWRNPRDKSKGSDVAYDHPLNDVLLNAPNSEMNAMTFEETFQSHVLQSGNGYAYKVLNNKGQVIGLKLLNWFSMQPKRDKDTGQVYYAFDDRGKETRFEKYEIFHIPGLGYDGLVGYSPIKMAMEAVGLGLAAEEFAARFYSNGANVGGFITMDATVQDKDSLKTEFETKFGGLGKAHKVIFLENGMQFQRLNMNLDEAQFIETRRFQIEEIARIYRMPPHMIGDLTHATFSNIEHQDLAYVKRTLLPWIKRWEIATDTQNLTLRDRQQGLFSRLNIDELLRGDAPTRASVNHIKRQDGVISTNEWRAVDDMNPRLEPEADKLLINGNMRDISVVNSTEPINGQQFKQDDLEEKQNMLEEKVSSLITLVQQKVGEK
jgi:HK97 family phage portal protein